MGGSTHVCSRYSGELLTTGGFGGHPVGGVGGRGGQPLVAITWTVGTFGSSPLAIFLGSPGGDGVAMYLLPCLKAPVRK